MIDFSILSDKQYESFLDLLNCNPGQPEAYLERVFANVVMKYI